MSETVEETKLVQNSIFADFRKSHKCLIMNGANDRIRTDDLRITNALLYRLSYIGGYGRLIYRIFFKNQVREKIFF